MNLMRTYLPFEYLVIVPHIRIAVPPFGNIQRRAYAETEYLLCGQVFLLNKSGVIGSISSLCSILFYMAVPDRGIQHVFEGLCSFNNLLVLGT